MGSTTTGRKGDFFADSLLRHLLWQMHSRLDFWEKDFPPTVSLPQLFSMPSTSHRVSGTGCMRRLYEWWRRGSVGRGVCRAKYDICASTCPDLVRRFCKAEGVCSRYSVLPHNLPRLMFWSGIICALRPAVWFERRLEGKKATSDSSLTNKSYYNRDER